MQIFDQMRIGFISDLKDEEWADKQRMAGKVCATALSYLENEIKNRTTKTFAQLDKEAEEIIRSFNCSPCFKNYHGFPNSVCISVNKELVHGIPKDIYPKDGDKISFDLGANFDGAIADTALTVIYGEPKDKRHIELLKATKKALNNAIKQVSIGQRIGAIGEEIYKTGRQYDFAVVEKYGGHSIGFLDTPHAPPFISNRSNKEEGIHFVSGMSLAIEPLFVLGNSNETKISNDGWTVLANDICAHEEHTLYIHQNGEIEVMTRRENEN
jgi:methionyl aminopeptidase